LLPAREQVRFRFVFVRQLFDLLVQVSLARGFYYFGKRSIHLAIANVLFNRSLKDMILLQHETDFPAQEVRLVP
jgi:hypothetical protein